MSRLTELQRKAAVIRYYLRKHQRYPSNVKAPIDLLGMTRAGFEKWINGDTSNPHSLNRIDANLKAKLQLQATSANLLDGATGVMELGHKLGLSRAECQIAIDEVASELGPTFLSFSMTSDQANGLLKVFQGLYVIYRLERTEQAKEATENDLSVMCMTMSVRHKLTGTKPLSRDLNRLRCKLHIPSYRVHINLFEYDGYITQTDPSGKYYWLFEARHDIERDIVFMMTDVLQARRVNGKQRLYCHGTMITRSQDMPGRPMVWPILIERKAELADPEKQVDESFERSAEKIFTSDHAALRAAEELDPWVMQALLEAEKFATYVQLEDPTVGDSWRKLEQAPSS